jgi:hypothetical protein
MESIILAHAKYWKDVHDMLLKSVGRDGITTNMIEAYRQCNLVLSRMTSIEDLRTEWKFWKLVEKGDYSSDEKQVATLILAAVENLGEHLKNPTRGYVNGYVKKIVQQELI